MKVAVKVFDQGSRDKRQAHREVKVLSRVSHPNILEAYEVIESSLFSQLVCELVDGESLRAFAQRQPGHRLEESTARHYYQQVVDGVSFCHDRLVVHRDLKLENLLLDRSGECVKIIDFGFATQVASKEAKLRAFCGTPSYMAPEIVRGEGYSGFATDVWALGVVIFALLAGSLPFIGRTEMQLYAKIRRGTFTCPDALGEAPRRLVRAMLRLEPASRPSSAAILRQPWVSGVPHEGARTIREGCSAAGNSDIDGSVLKSPTLNGHRLPLQMPAGGGENDSAWILNSPGRTGSKNSLEPRKDFQAMFWTACMRMHNKELS
jgi:MAP/microtubule affinity-regulating kinase